MPNLRAISGQPLPDQGMAAGTVSVRVARKIPANAVAGVEVVAITKNSGGDLRKRTAKTDAGGRALFESLAPGDEFHAEVTVDGEPLKTVSFPIPAQGGVRTMLIAALGPAACRGGPRPTPRRPAAPAFAIGSTTGSAQARASLPTKTLEVHAHRRERPPDPEPSRHARLGRHREQGRRAPRPDRRLGRRALHRPADGQDDGLRRRHRLARHAHRDRSLRDARGQRRARRDPRARAHERSIGHHDRRGRAHHPADARGHAAVPRDPSAREQVRQALRPGPRRHRDPAAVRVHGRRGGPERPQARDPPEPRRRHSRRDLAEERARRRRRQDGRQRGDVRLRHAVPRRHARVRPAHAHGHRPLHAHHRTDPGPPDHGRRAWARASRAS